jgi:hypothetical protein
VGAYPAVPGWDVGSSVSRARTSPGLGDLQRLAELKGLLPGLTCLLVAAEPEESITKVLQRLGLAPAVAELPMAESQRRGAAA